MLLAILLALLAGLVVAWLLGYVNMILAIIGGLITTGLVLAALWTFPMVQGCPNGEIQTWMGFGSCVRQVPATASAPGTGTNTGAAPGGNTAAQAQPAQPAQTGMAAAPGSRWVGTAQITSNSTGVVPTGKRAHGNMDIDIAAGQTVVLEGWEIGEVGKPKTTGPLIVCVNGPYKGTVWVHDGMAWDPVPSGQRGAVADFIQQNWLLHTPPLRPTEKRGC